MINEFNDNFNFKLNIYSDTWKNPSINPNPENINISNDYNNIFNHMNMNNNIPNNNLNYTNSQNEQEINLNKNNNNNNNNKPIGFNNNVINNNVFNIGYDIKAAPFLP